MSIARSSQFVLLMCLLHLPIAGYGQQPNPQELYKRGKGLIERNWKDSYGPSKEELLDGVSKLEKAVEGGYTANGKAFKYIAGGYETLASRFATDDAQKKAYFAKARDAYQRQIAAVPTQSEPRMNLAELLKEEGLKDAALAQYMEVLNNDPNHALAHFFTGFILLDKGNSASAVAHFQAAVNMMDLDMLGDVGGQMADALKKNGLANEASQLRAAIASRQNSQ